MLQLIEAVCAQDAGDEGASVRTPFNLEECFIPKFRSQKKIRGEWKEVERLLMPSYVVAVTNDPDQLAQRLRKIPYLCHVLTMGETYVPLTSYERSWLEAYTSKGDRVVPMSFGHKEGDMLVVTEGPLKGQEGRIIKINRAASLAFLEFHVGQFKITTTVGLGIVPS